MREIEKKRAALLVATLAGTFVVLRVYLHLWPSTNLNVGRYNVHHLFTGLLLIALGGIPLAVSRGPRRLLDVATAVFGVGLAMALDEWVYLIVTDGTDASYVLPVSFWGGVSMVVLACVYVLALVLGGRGGATGWRLKLGSRLGDSLRDGKP